MLDNQYISWIKHHTSGHYPATKLEESLLALTQIFEMDTKLPLFASTIEEMANASDMDKTLFIKNFTNIERFMKLVIDIIHPGLRNNPPQPLFQGDHSTTWTLANLYKEAFHIVPFNFNLTKESNHLNSHKNDPNNLYHYLFMYSFRNNDTHEGANLSYDLVQQAILSTLITELDLCYRNKDIIAAKYKAKLRRESFPSAEFAASIRKAYSEHEKNGFGYLDLHWISKEDPSLSDCNAEKLASRTNFQPVKILGEAGSGKSTVLKRIEYLMAKKLKNGKASILPLYIELYSLSDGNQILLKKIADVMKIDLSLVQDYLEAGELCLLLDGFNEILNLTVKKKLAKELDQFSAHYPNVRIYLSDRAVARTGIPTLSDAAKMYMRPITTTDRKDYFEKNCQDKSCLELLLNKLETQPEYFEPLNTPLKLKQLMEVAAFRKEIPDDITDDYIHFLMERESREKKDENIEYLPVFLQSLAILDQENIPFLKATAQFAKCKSALGYSIPDTNQCLKLAIDMGILVCEENNMIRFATQEYQAYFEMEGLFNDLDTILN